MFMYIEQVSPKLEGSRQMDREKEFAVSLHIYLFIYLFIGKKKRKKLDIWLFPPHPIQIPLIDVLAPDDSDSKDIICLYTASVGLHIYFLYKLQ